jgi:hypothetical protein
LVSKHGSCSGFAPPAPTIFSYRASFTTPANHRPPGRQSTPAGLHSGLPRIGAAGAGRWLRRAALHPSPYTAQDVELIYSSQEHITVIRWRISSTAPLEENRFEISANGYQTIDFFAVGVRGCQPVHGQARRIVRAIRRSRRVQSS